MKKLLVFLVVLFGISGLMTMTVYATDTTEPDTTEEVVDDGIVEDGIVEDTNLQLETIKNIIVSAVVGFLSSATFIILARFIINGVVKEIRNKIALAESQNKISTDNATLVNKRVDELKAYIEDNVLTSFSLFVEQFKTVDIDIKTLIEQYRIRDAKLGELLEQGLGDDDAEE
jgi:hypothetical protein